MERNKLSNCTNKNFCDMDYEQEYEKVLEMAREAFYSPETPHICKAWLLTMFPTIAESEDEKMRKSIIYALQNGGFYSKDKTDEAITWLEKQGHMLDADKVIEWLKANVYDDSAYGKEMIEKFKKDFGL